MKEKILSIEKGWGLNSTYFTTDEKAKNFPTYVDEIVEETKVIGAGYYNDLTIIVFCGYLNGNKIFEIESNSGLTINVAKEQSL